MTETRVKKIELLIDGQMIFNKGTQAIQCRAVLPINVETIRLFNMCKKVNFIHTSGCIKKLTPHG